MSAEDCPFELIRPDDDDVDVEKKDSFVSFKMLIDPNDAEGQKTTLNVKKLNSSDPEDVLNHLQTFEHLVEQLDTAKRGTEIPPF